jgi:hypothetical protein
MVTCLCSKFTYNSDLWSNYFSFVGVIMIQKEQPKKRSLCISIPHIIADGKYIRGGSACGLWSILQVHIRLCICACNIVEQIITPLKDLCSFIIKST